METNLQEEKDKLLWKIAKKRVEFKRQRMMYVIINTMLWIIWYLTDRRAYDHGAGILIPWPLWCTLGWGIALIWSYYGAYYANFPDSIQKEFEKLKSREKI
jgi:2TM domain